MFRLVLCLILLGNSLFATVQKEIKTPFCVVTIAKSGSHLLQKSLFLLTGWKGEWADTQVSFSEMSLRARYPWTHFLVNAQLQSYFSPMKKIVMIRDPRDICISMVYMILSDLKTRKRDYKKWRKSFLRLSFDEQLLGVITGKFIPIAKDPHLQWNVLDTLPQVVEWTQNPGVLICSFENLVGERGGGSTKLQEGELTKISSYLNLSVSQQEIERIAPLLFGDDHTFGLMTNFRDGRSRTWQKLFNEEHKRAFKSRLGKYLIALGYENDDNW